MKTDFRSIVYSLVLSLAAATFHAGAAELEPSRPNLTGTIRVKDGPVLGDASVFIYTAGPRVGPGFL